MRKKQKLELYSNPVKKNSNIRHEQVDSHATMNYRIINFAIDRIDIIKL